MDEDTCCDFSWVAKLTLSSPGANGGRLLVDLREAQLAGPEIKPVLMRMEERNDKPSWVETAPHSQATKIYCSLWESLRILDSVLKSALGDTLWGRHYKELVLLKALRSDVLQQLYVQCPNSWSLGDCQDPESCQGEILPGLV